MAMITDLVELGALGARHIQTDTDPEELVLPEESALRLRRIADWLVQPPPVHREWGLHRYIDGGLRALFRGPHGTGKTMAAAAIGRWTDRPVFQVDLGATMSAHGGEGARNLNRIFEAAVNDSAILYFDEADAHDIQGNVETGYLLRRLEPFEGLAIIAANGRGKIDEDAVSRLDAIVDFPMPDEAAREQLWRRILGNVKMSQSGGQPQLDTGLLAGKYELSGAEITRCVRLAALLAASEDKPLDMNLLKDAAEERLAMRESG
jgi:SpoVK/Ycf46/Vps4 family AAA+-type ATPase